MPIDVASAGSTPAQDRVAVEEAAHLFLSTAQEMGTLQEVLEECAYEFREGAWQAPECVSVERDSARSEEAGRPASHIRIRPVA